jgi:hypothetical protein
VFRLWSGYALPSPEHTPSPLILIDAEALKLIVAQQEAGRALLREWPDYQKPMTRAALAHRVDLVAVLRAAAVEPELEGLLRCVGLIEVARLICTVS